MKFMNFQFQVEWNAQCTQVHFLTYETEFVLFLAVLENSVLPMG